ncbi:hypothetical protein SEVIR_3G284400v4 [Setaria viridis]|uniref:Uncharacterized protein n=2 Tax=Setaria TaxID=4554 RepID=A0A368QK05_SETIT|nr:hypothetical protein SETIT_3G276900v2 [Setaria italica]TKW27844.1 hypothetical protein SEVIR_3G284400v2 [Setaria viridis]
MARPGYWYSKQISLPSSSITTIHPGMYSLCSSLQPLHHSPESSSPIHHPSKHPPLRHEYLQAPFRLVSLWSGPHHRTSRILLPVERHQQLLHPLPWSLVDPICQIAFLLRLE